MDLNVLIIGGGITGTGLFHDLTSRKIPGVHLVERKKLAAGTSSRSTKLIHGGVRYLERLSQWGLVHEALQERARLLRILRGLVKPLPFVLPNFKGGRPPWLVRTGLFFYDFLAGDGGLPSSRYLPKEDILKYAPYLKQSRIDQDMQSALLYYDAQMLDDVIVRLVAFAGVKLGGTFTEDTDVEKITSLPGGGYEVILSENGVSKTVTTKFIVNACGAWNNANLLRWGINPKIPCLLNVGSHLVFSSEVVKPQETPPAASLIQNKDGRVVFFIPWFNKWLLGTTESVLHGSPDAPFNSEADINYLKDVMRENLDLQTPEKFEEEFFWGVRTMPMSHKVKPDHIESWTSKPFESPFYQTGKNVDISKLSRESVVDETLPRFLSIYGGKYTTFRSLSEKIGSQISSSLGLGGKSGTLAFENWFLDEFLITHPESGKSDPSIRQL